MSEHVPQAWRFGDGPNQYYADQYATFTARLDYDLDYDDDRFEQYKAEFLADLAAHDREVKAEAWDEAVDWLDAGNDPDQIDMRSANPYRIESKETP